MKLEFSPHILEKSEMLNFMKTRPLGIDKTKLPGC